MQSKTMYEKSQKNFPKRYLAVCLTCEKYCYVLNPDDDDALSVRGIKYID